MIITLKLNVFSMVPLDVEITANEKSYFGIQ